MDLGTLIGIALGIGSVIACLILEGGTLGSLVQIPAAVLVIGGTYGATIAASDFRTFLRSPANFLKAVMGRLPHREELCRTLVQVAGRARREGLLALEADLPELSDPILRKALQLVVDGATPETMVEIMEAELGAREAEARKEADFFTSWCGLGPTLGVTGAIMGLIHMMGHLDDPGAMGPAIAAAFCATLYGVAIANLIYIPIGKKLTLLAQQERAAGEIVIEGVRAIQEGATPLAVRQRLEAHLGGVTLEAESETSADLPVAA